MQLITYPLPRSSKRLIVAPIGDIQWSGDDGPTAQSQLKDHINRCLDLDAYFIGLGDYIDFLSPSNRSRLIAAGLYDTAQSVIAEKANELSQELFDRFLAPTKGRWLGMVEGHHFHEADGSTTDMKLAELLKTKFLGTSAYIKVKDVVFYAHHGIGGGKLPGAAMNTIYHLAAGLPGADVYLMGHTTKLSTSRVSRPFPVWTHPARLEHKDVWLVNTGGFCKSNIVDHKHGSIPRGDYAEQKLMTPSPLTAPIIRVEWTKTKSSIRVEI